MMKAIVQTKYGSSDMLELREVDRPAVRDDQMLSAFVRHRFTPMFWHVLRRPVAS
jgi:hypothetical protein